MTVLQGDQQPDASGSDGQGTTRLSGAAALAGEVDLTDNDLVTRVVIRGLPTARPGLP